MRRLLSNVIWTTLGSVVAASMAQASMREIPLPELVRISDVIVTGQIINVDKTEVRAGVFEVICHIRVDSTLKGQPRTAEMILRGERLVTVPIQFYDGDQVPSGKRVYQMGEEGIWFLTSIEKERAGRYEASGYIDPSRLAAVREELRKQAGLPRTFNVGYEVLDLEQRVDGRQQTLSVAVWYPTAARPTPHDYGGPTRGRVAVDAEPLSAGGPFPLLVFSHGYGGSGIGAVFFTEALAARGWIVACPDHHDPQSAVRIRTGQVRHFDRLGLLRHAKEIAASGPGDRDKYLYRLDELKRALDGLLASERLGGRIDRDRIAVGGHSFGGFTALGLCGTIPERRDPRIKAVLLFSTGAGGYLYTPEELQRVRIPSMLWMGEREERRRRGAQTMARLSGKIYGNLSAPKYFLELKGANHFSFNNRFTERPGAKMLGGSEPQFEVIRRYSIAFLEHHVAGRPDAGRVLSHPDPMLVRLEHEGLAR